FCFDFHFACDAPAVGFPILVSELSERSKCKGQPGMATASPPAGAATRGHGRLRPALPPTGAAVPAGKCSVTACTGQQRYSATHDAMAGDHDAL
ncbi:hypothetical protein BHE74_00039189, partial [Ensete ventricosum]